MPDGSNRPDRGNFFLIRFALVWMLTAPALPAAAQAITNLQQLTQALNSEQQVYREVHLKMTVCAASRPQVGVLIVQDETGVELLEIGDFGREILPGERISIQGWFDFFRKREMGVEITRWPLVNNDGMHFRRTLTANITLKAGMTPLRVDWFHGLRDLSLDVSCNSSNGPSTNIMSSNFWHAVVDESSGQTNFLPGLRAECYEGYWEAMPDFNLLQPVKTGIVTNIDIGFRTRDERVGIRYTGYWDVPQDGQYTFRLRSENGSLLFLIKPEVQAIRVGVTNVPVPWPGLYDEAMDSLTERRWTIMEGGVGFVTKQGEGIEFDLHSDRDVISVRVADADGLDLARLRNARVRVAGVGRAVLAADQRLVLGKLFAASIRDVQFVKEAPESKSPLPLASVRQVQSLRIEDARQGLPVRLRGVVTDAKNSPYDRWMSFQDDTRGVFVRLTLVSNTFPAFEEVWEVQGHSEAGDFAPVVMADKMTFLGLGRLPEPVRPTWTELLNGSMDVQWAELQGLVTDVQSNRVTLLLPEGRLEVQMAGFDQLELEPFLKTVARIRGVLYAVWDAGTREVHVGSVLMRNATISVDTSAPADPFDAVLKTPRELLLFDAQATAFRRVKVRGQIIWADATQIFLQEDGVGLRLLPAGKTDVRPGDLVETTGYPDIGRPALSLREVLVRKTGEAAMLEARKLTESELTLENLDSTRVRVEGRLLGWHLEQGTPVLEMQSGTHLYLARLAPGESPRLLLRAGSRLALEGVYVAHGRNLQPEGEAESFELLLNSPAGILVVSQPSWWTLRRLLILVGVLLVILAFTAVWITQLRRLVERRTAQLQRETRERERIEQRHALEAERSRIARDLHDDLGSSLTEISALASTGQSPLTAETSHANLFQVITNKARGLIAALDVIVWAVDPEDNSLQSLADYLSGYAADFFSHTNQTCRFKVPVAFPQITLEGRVRHDLLMVVKETMNNIVRHAEATEVEFRMAVSNEILEIEITDNGIGFEGVTEKDRHGLKNLPARLKKIGGDCAVESRLGGGTTVKIRLPLPASGGVKTAGEK
jgi:signal transduction histidine kinase